MNDQERHALEKNIANLAADIHETEKRLAPIERRRAELETQLSEQRNTNEALILENAGIRGENEQLGKHLDAAQPIVEIMTTEHQSVRNTAHAILTELVLAPSERRKREQLIKSAESLFSLRMWIGVWKAERDRPKPPATAAPQTQLSMGVL